MNKKEIAEIKKQFTPANCSITRICGCYVDAEKIRKPKLKKLSIPFQRKKCLSILTFSRKPCLADLERTL